MVSINAVRKIAIRFFGLPGVATSCSGVWTFAVVDECPSCTILVICYCQTLELDPGL